MYLNRYWQRCQVKVVFITEARFGCLFIRKITNITYKPLEKCILKRSKCHSCSFVLSEFWVCFLEMLAFFHCTAALIPDMATLALPQLLVCV